MVHTASHGSFRRGGVSHNMTEKGFNTGFHGDDDFYAFWAECLCNWGILWVALAELKVLLSVTEDLMTDESFYSVKVSGIEIKPDPVVRAGPLTFKMSATTGKPIPGGKWKIGVEYFGILVHEEIRDLCELISCPVTPGNFVIAHTQNLPAYAPVGTYIVDMTLKNEKDEPLTCITFNFKLVFDTPVLSDI
ncbi:hypothetical protein RIF29_27450 [Crotalaria pallida]|uniref:MD-2-related lipid-recognition domain-containing protein n=1 Tax=Crotalaria pallida TaxID=3830 RepID=A0AAN9I5L0_CROPI